VNLGVEGLLKSIYALLPCKKARVLFALGATLSLGFLALCQYANIGTLLQLEQAQKLAVLLGSALLLLLGSWLAILFVSIEFKNQSFLHKNEISSIEEKMILINKYLEINKVSWAMVESDVIKHKSFNEGLNKVLKSNKNP